MYDLDQLYQEYSARIYKRCLIYSGDQLLADDLHQATWIAVRNRLSILRSERKISTWIYRIAVNTCLIGRKKEKKQDAKLDDTITKLHHFENQFEKKKPL